MKSLFKSYGFLLFLAIAVLDLIGIQWQNETIHLIAKPLLIPILFFTLFFSRSQFTKTWLVLVGLVFSFTGDVFLLFDNQYPICFILGLVSFLLTHFFYIIFFLNIPSTQASLFKKHFYFIIPVVLYVGALLFLLIPKLGALQIPVLVYALVLGTMLLSSMHVWYKVGNKAGTLFIAGALFFVLSDSLLAINKFYMPLPFAGVSIMLTYCIAQFLIVKGMLSKKN